MRCFCVGVNNLIVELLFSTVVILQEVLFDLIELRHHVVYIVVEAVSALYLSQYLEIRNAHY